MRKRSGGGIGKIGGIMDDALAQNQLAEGMRPHRAVALYAEIVGEQLATVSAAEAVRGGVLFIRARSGTWATELTFHTADILARLNARLGGRVLTDIHVKAGGRGPRAAKAAVAPAPAIPGEDDLRDPQAMLPAQDAPSGANAFEERSPQERIQAVRARAARALAWKRAHGWVSCARCSALTAPDPARTRPPEAPSLCALCRQVPRPYG